MRSSPHHHQGNGIAEASVKSMKALIVKMTTNGKLDTDAFHDAAVEFRNTPRANGLSPAQAVLVDQCAQRCHPCGCVRCAVASVEEPSRGESQTTYS